MKPEIVSYDFGRHNADGLAASRILEGGSWKNQRTIILIPSAATIPAKVALSHWNLQFPPNQPIHRMLCLGMEVGEAYSAAIEAILAHPQLRDWEYVLTLEHDNIGPPDGVMSLYRQMEAHPELSAISGLYWTKGEGGVPQIWGDVKDPLLNFRPQVPVTNQLVECCGTGMGFVLWRLAMFRDPRMHRPFFKTEAGATQDLFFWSRARPLGFRCAVDCSVRVGHMDAASDIVW